MIDGDSDQLQYGPPKIAPLSRLFALNCAEGLNKATLLPAPLSNLFLSLKQALPQIIYGRREEKKGRRWNQKEGRRSKNNYCLLFDGDLEYEVPVS